MPQSFSGKNLQGCSFKNQDLTAADFSRADIRGADFTNAILIGANFNQAIAGLQQRSILILLVALGFLGVLVVFTIGVIAAFTGDVLTPGQASRGITTFTNVTDTELEQLAHFQGYTDKFFFWDGVHPTTAAHSVLAKTAFSLLQRSTKTLSSTL